MSDIRTWIRVEDEFGQYDHDEARPLPDGVRRVEGYPKHVSPWARDSKPRTNKGGKPAEKNDGDKK